MELTSHVKGQPVNTRQHPPSFQSDPCPFKLRRWGICEYLEMPFGNYKLCLLRLEDLFLIFALLIKVNSCFLFLHCPACTEPRHSAGFVPMMLCKWMHKQIIPRGPCPYFPFLSIFLIWCKWARLWITAGLGAISQPPWNTCQFQLNTELLNRQIQEESKEHQWIERQLALSSTTKSEIRSKSSHRGKNKLKMTVLSKGHIRGHKYGLVA